MGIINGFILWGYNLSIIRASAKGSYAFANVSMLFGGIIIPFIYNLAFLHSKVTVLQVIAIGIMFLAMYFMNADEINFKNAHISYFLYCFLLFMCNGLYGTMLKIQDVHYGNESTQMVIITYAIMGIVSVFDLSLKEKKNFFSAFKLNKQCVFPLIACLVSASLAINVLVFIIPLIDITVLYTYDNAGVMLLSALYSFFIFKEKPTKFKILGVAFAAISIIAMSI